jgi:hypothetical protein
MNNMGGIFVYAGIRGGGEYGKKWHDLLLDSKLIDCVLIGEGDYALARIVKNDLFGLVIEPQLNNMLLEQIPIPDYSDYVKRKI